MMNKVMLYWAAVFFVISLVAAILGFSGFADAVGVSGGVAKILFFVFLLLGGLSLLFAKAER